MNDDFPLHFARVFASLDRHNLQRLEQIYSPDLHFTDPLHSLDGLVAMRRYCENLYQNVSAIDFAFHQCQSLGEGQAVLRWTMTYRHLRLNRGKPIKVNGCSHIQYHDRLVYQHIDYYDAGALLYEHLPILGRIIRWLKGRLA